MLHYCSKSEIDQLNKLTKGKLTSTLDRGCEQPTNSKSGLLTRQPKGCEAMRIRQVTSRRTVRIATWMLSIHGTDLKMWSTLLLEV